MNYNSPYFGNNKNNQLPQFPVSPQRFTCYINGNDIVMDSMTGPQIIGVTMEVENARKSEIAEKDRQLEEYYDLLVEHKILEPERSPEEIIQEQGRTIQQCQSFMAQQGAMLKKLMDELGVQPESLHQPEGGQDD